MSAVLETSLSRTGPALTPASSGKEGAVVLALGRVEARHLLRHPLFLAGAALGLLLSLPGPFLQAPVLHRDDIDTAFWLLPLAGATLLVVNLAVLRARRHDTTELYESLPASPSARTGGHLVSLGAAAVVAALVVVAAVAYMVALGGIWAPSAAELATGPAIVVLAGALGVLAARWAPSPTVAPVLALGAVAASLSGSLGWFAPWIGIDTMPRELFIRPAGWHLLYLLGVAGLVAVAALWRHGTTPRLAVAGAAVVSLIAVTGVMQAQPPSASQQAAIAELVTSGEALACEARGAVEYCAFPAYGGWVERWAAVVEPVLQRVPAPLWDRGLVVRQRPGDYEVYNADISPSTRARLFDEAGHPVAQPDDGSVSVGMRWGRGPSLGRSQLVLALDTAAWAVGLPHVTGAYTVRDGGGSLLETASCWSGGQARSVVALWLAGSATPATDAALRAVIAAEPYAFGPPAQYRLLFGQFSVSAPIRWSKADTNYAAQLLDRPTDEVTALVNDHWDQLMDPTTTTDDLVALAGLGVLPTRAEPLPAAGVEGGGGGVDDPLLGGVACP